MMEQTPEGSYNMPLLSQSPWPYLPLPSGPSFLFQRLLSEMAAIPSHRLSLCACSVQLSLALHVVVDTEVGRTHLCPLRV